MGLAPHTEYTTEMWNRALHLLLYSTMQMLAGNQGQLLDAPHHCLSTVIFYWMLTSDISDRWMPEAAAPSALPHPNAKYSSTYCSTIVVLIHYTYMNTYELF